jgi:hypothetical protein
MDTYITEDSNDHISMVAGSAEALGTNGITLEHGDGFPTYDKVIKFVGPGGSTGTLTYATSSAEFIVSGSGTGVLTLSGNKVSGSAISTGSFGRIQTAGVIAADDDVIAFASSDERLKGNIKTIENPIKKVEQLRGVEFQWNGLQNAYPSGSYDSGIIAQDVQKVLPQIVKEKKSGYLGVRQERLVGLLIEGIKDQQKQIDELKLQIKEIKDGSS